MRSLLLALWLAAPVHAAVPSEPPKPTISEPHPKGAPVLTIDQRAELKLRARVELARRAAAEGDILSWGKALFPHKFNRGFCAELHGYFVSIRREELTATEAPRDHAKTTIKCFLIPIYQALQEHDTFKVYLNVQSTEKKALAINVSIRNEIESNQALRLLYGDQVGEKKWTDQIFALQNGVAFMAAGAGQSIRGINYLNQRPDYIIVDDLYDDEDINNPESTQLRTEWFWQSLYPARSETADRSCVHVQGTAINEVDLLVALSKAAKDLGVKYRTFSAVDWTTKTVLWPELKSFEQRTAQKALMPTIIFEREYENKRGDSAAAIVKRQWLYPIDGSKSWEYDPAELKFDQKVRVMTAAILSIDPSVGEKNENDPTAMALVLKVQRVDSPVPVLPEFYIEQAVNKRMDSQERIDAANEIINGRMPGREVTLARVESIGGFKDFGKLLSKSVKVGVDLVDKVPDKISHLQNKSHYFQNKRVHLNKHLPPELKDAIVYQITTNHPVNDDLRDAILHGLDDESGMWRHV